MKFLKVVTATGFQYASAPMVSVNVVTSTKVVVATDANAATYTFAAAATEAAANALADAIVALSVATPGLPEATPNSALVTSLVCTIA